MRAAIYTRVSTAEQAEGGTSLESQTAACRRLAAELGAAVVAEYRDVDSGTKEAIPGLMALQDAALAGEFDVVLVDHPDRFSRNLVKKVVIRRDLLRTGVELRYAALRVDDSAEGRLLENMTAVVAEYERERIAFRTNRGRYAKAARGLVVGTGAAPYGYEYVRENDVAVGLRPNPVTAPVIARIFAALLDRSAARIAAELDADGIPAPRGDRWLPRSILSMARNPAYMGRAAYGQSDQAGGGHRARPRDTWTYAAVPAIVPEDRWQRVQVAIGARNQGGHVRWKDDDPYLLRGRLTCAGCGLLLACVPNGRTRYYVCTRSYPSHAAIQGKAVCPLPSVRAEGGDGLEELVRRSVRAALLDTDGLRASMERQRAAERNVADKRRAPLGRELERQRQRLHRATDLLLDAEPGTATDADLRRRARDAQDAITRLEAELEAIGSAAPMTDEALADLSAFAATVRGEIDGYGPAEWRELLDALDVRLTLRPDPDGIRIGRRARIRADLTAIIPIGLLHRKNVFSNICAPHSISLPIAV